MIFNFYVEGNKNFIVDGNFEFDCEIIIIVFFFVGNLRFRRR